MPFGVAFAAASAFAIGDVPGLRPPAQLRARWLPQQPKGWSPLHQRPHRAPLRLPGSRAISDEDYVLPAKRVAGHGPIAVLRSVSLAVVLFSLGLIFCPFLFVSLFFVRRRDPVRRRFIDRALQLWARMVVWPFFKVKVVNPENLLPDSESCVYVANHQSFMDILSVYHLSRSFKFISKDSILKIPLVGWAMGMADHVTIQREDRKSQMQAFKSSISKLQNGCPIFVFPEGTRSADGALIKFKKGPIAMAKRANVPVVPVTILGTGRVMPPGKEYQVFYSPAGVKIVVHPHVSAADVEKEDADVLLERVRVAIDSALPASLQSKPAS